MHANAVSTLLEGQEVQVVSRVMHVAQPEEQGEHVPTLTPAVLLKEPGGQEVHLVGPSPSHAKQLLSQIEQVEPTNKSLA